MSSEPTKNGSIFLESTKTDHGILLRVYDSGPGLLLDKIKEKAQKIGKKVDSFLSDQELAQFIFLPNLSTKEIVTAISGRGVGMDFVKSTVEKLGGSIEVDLLGPNPNSAYHKFVLKIDLPLEFLQGFVP